MNETNINYKDLADFLIDFLCETKSPEETIKILIGFGLDAEQLEDIGFDRKDIDDEFALIE